MKWKASIIGSTIVLAAAALGGIPGTMTYQGRLTTSAGNVVTDGTYNLTFTIYDAPLDGTALWGETLNVAVTSGLFTAELGQLHPLAMFGFSDPDRWLGITIDSDPELDPRQRLGSVAYSFHAAYADSSGSSMMTDTIWQASDGNAYRLTGRVGIGTATPLARLHVRGGNWNLGTTSGDFMIGDSLYQLKFGVALAGLGAGDARIRAVGGSGCLMLGGGGDDVISINRDGPVHAYPAFIQISGNSGSPHAGRFYFGDGTGWQMHFSKALPPADLVTITDKGVMATHAANGTYRVLLSSVNGADNNGAVAVLNGSNQIRAEMHVRPEGDGEVYTFGPNGNFNCLMSSLAGYDNNGYVQVCDAAGNVQAGMYVNASGNGIVFGDTKSLRIPNRDQPGTDIWYACPEGPEAAAYVRGTARLVNGRATIVPPAHFLEVASTTGITVQLTPLSAESKGLAVTEKTLSRISVQELGQGSGSYEFDYIVMAVRQGHEDYRVIRPSSEVQSSPSRTVSIPAE